MTPLGHIGIALSTGYVFRFSLPLVFAGAILPDLIDKPLEALGIGGGRYIAHTLLFVFVVAGLFYIWKNKYGLSILLGMISHLFLDSEGFIPWFYPFKNYEFPETRFSPLHFPSNLFDLILHNSGFSVMLKDMGFVMVAVIAMLMILGLRYWFKTKKSRLNSSPSQDR